jgi:predicted Zn-dependent peptidase
MGGSKPAPAPGPSAAEIAAEQRALKKIEDEEKRKEEEEAQRKLSMRGRRSLLAEDNTGAGFQQDMLG